MATYTTNFPARDLVTSGMPDVSKPSMSGLELDIADLYRVALRDRWGKSLIWIGWMHLAVFVVCDGLFKQGDRAASHFLPLWGLDVFIGLAIVRKTLLLQNGERTPSLFFLVVRIWITFLILAFSTVSLNSLMGWETDWFKVSWATLSTFGFAMMAWIFHLKFLIPAVQMSLTALLIVRFPDHAYAIYGLSWCIALNGIGYSLEKRRRLLLGSQTDDARRIRSTSRMVSLGRDGIQSS